MTDPKPKSSAAWFSESLARGLLVLRVFNRERPRLSASEVAELTSLSRAAARRYLLTLQDLGYVGVDQDRYYLRPRILDLGYGYLSSTGIEELASRFCKTSLNGPRARPISPFSTIGKC